MDSPVPPIPEGPKEYQIEAVSAICRRGFDHKSLIALARLECEQGRKGVYHYLNSFLDAIAFVPIDEVSRWIHSVGSDPTRRPSQQPPVEALTRSSIDPILERFPAPPVQQPSYDVPNKRIRIELRTTAHGISNTSVPPQIVYYHGLCYRRSCRTKSWKRAGNFMNHFANHLAEYGNAADGYKCCDLTTLDPAVFAEHQWKQHMQSYTLPAVHADAQASAARARASYPQHPPPHSNNQSASAQSLRPVSDPVLSQSFASIVDEDPMSAHPRTSTPAHILTEMPRVPANSRNPGPIQSNSAATYSLPAAIDNHPQYPFLQGNAPLHPATISQHVSSARPDIEPIAPFTDEDMDMSFLLPPDSDTPMSWPSINP